MYKPSTHNPATKNNISSNKESLAKTTDEDPMIEKCTKGVSSPPRQHYWKNDAHLSIMFFSRTFFYIQPVCSKTKK